MWAITTGLLLPLAKNGMEDRPDLAEKVVRAHLISGAIVDVSPSLNYGELTRYSLSSELTRALLAIRSWHC